MVVAMSAERLEAKPSSEVVIFIRTHLASSDMIESEADFRFKIAFAIRSVMMYVLATSSSFIAYMTTELMRPMSVWSSID